jgi:hypothetical protein
VPTFVDRGVSHSQSGGSITAIVSVLHTGAATFFSFKQLLSFTHEAEEWTLFQTHYFSENLVVPGIKSGPLDL